MKRICLQVIGSFATSCFLCSCLSAQTTAPETKPNVVLVELFTSEGCSSCPPADALLREINGTITKSGQLIVGISEHVTYWNSLGWADPFSSAVSTERQNAYGRRFGLDSVYTPQMVVNGTEQFTGSDRGGLAQALRTDSTKPTPVSLHILSTKVLSDILVVKFSTASALPALKGDVIAVLTDDLDQSSVARGENSGRQLTHVAVARAFSRVSALQISAEQEVRLPLPSFFKQKQKHHVILFAQAPSYGRVLGVDTSPVPALE